MTKAKVPDWYKQKRREERALAGNPTGWGGKREGSGRKRQDYTQEEIVVKLNITQFQHKLLLELGNGSVRQGIQNIINESV